MEANFKQTTTDKEERYSLFLPQFELLISNEKEEVSVLANEVSLVTISAKEKEYAELHGLNLVH